MNSPCWSYRSTRRGLARKRIRAPNRRMAAKIFPEVFHVQVVRRILSSSSSFLHDYRHRRPSHKIQSQGPAQDALGFGASPGETTRTHRYVAFHPFSIAYQRLTIVISDKKVRDAAFANVIEFLSNGGITQLVAPIEDAGGVIPRSAEKESEDVRRGQLPPLEMRRLWKGLFYCTSSVLPAWPIADILARLLDVRQAARSTTTRIRSLRDHLADQPSFHHGSTRRGRRFSREGHGGLGFHRRVLGSNHP